MKKGCLGVGIAGLMIAALVAATAITAWKWLGDVHEETRTITVAHVIGSAVEVETRNGTIRLRSKGEGDEVTVVATLRSPSEERLADAEVSVERNGEGALVGMVRWPGGEWKNREGCTFAIDAPDGVEGVRLKASNGSLQIEGTGGGASLDTRNGRIDLRGHTGDVRAETSNGAIACHGVDGRVNLRTSNGRIYATAINGGVECTTSNGGIDAELAKDSPGPVMLKTSNGAVSLVLGDRFSGTLTVDTSNGSIHTNDLMGAATVSSSKNHRVIEVGGGGAPSSVRTSNGSVTVRRRAAPK